MTVKVIDSILTFTIAKALGMESDCDCDNCTKILNIAEGYVPALKREIFEEIFINQGVEMRCTKCNNLCNKLGCVCCGGVMYYFKEREI